MSTTLNEVIVNVRRGHPNATRVYFINNGGRSKLIPVDIDTPPKPIALGLHDAITVDIVAAGHAHAKALYGARRNWPSVITVESVD